MNITIDVNKFSTQIIIAQDREPVFDTQSGLVSVPGSIRMQMQS